MSIDQPLERLRGLRGATTAINEAASIKAATGELLRALLDRNGVGPDDVVSILFTATEDLDAEFPAAAARELGLHEVPLMCAREMRVPHGVDHCIRVLVHFYSTKEPADLEHLYLGGAKDLRTDLRR